MKRLGLAILFLTALALAMGVVASGPGIVRAFGGTFNPTNTAQLSDDTAGANADLTTTFDIPDGDLQFQVLYTGVPEDFLPPTDDVPIGALVGRIDSVSTVGLFNGSCKTIISPTFPLRKAVLDDAPCTVKYSQQFADDDADGLQNGIECWPEFLTRMLPAGAKPLERFYGDSRIGATKWSENIVALAASDVPGVPASWGYVQIAILNDIGDPERQAKPKEAISDFCTPLGSTTITYGLSKDNPATPADESGFVVRNNPQYGGTYTFNFRAVSMYNSDNDGIENYQDTCPLTTNTDPSPHKETISMGPRGDGMDASCLADPNVVCGGPPPANCTQDYITSGLRTTDCDCDGFWNRLDTCPLVANGCSDTVCSNGESFPHDPSWNNQLDTDGDMIGDSCDPHPYTPDGVQQVVNNAADVEITVLAPAVGGIAELPDVSGSSGPPYAALAAGLASAFVALTAGGWYARRRWLR